MQLSDGSGRASIEFTPEEEEEFAEFARSGNVYKKLQDSLAPQIYGHEDIKKSLVTLLFGGSRKLLPDGDDMILALNLGLAVYPALSVCLSSSASSSCYAVPLALAFCLSSSDSRATSLSNSASRSLLFWIRLSLSLARCVCISVCVCRRNEAQRRHQRAAAGRPFDSQITIPQIYRESRSDLCVY